MLFKSPALIESRVLNHHSIDQYSKLFLSDLFCHCISKHDFDRVLNQLHFSSINHFLREISNLDVLGRSNSGKCAFQCHWADLPLHWVLLTKLWQFSNSKHNVRPYPDHCSHQGADQTLINIPFSVIEQISCLIEFFLAVHCCTSLDCFAVFHSKSFQNLCHICRLRQQYSIFTLSDLNTKASGQVTKTLIL